MIAIVSTAIRFVQIVSFLIALTVVAVHAAPAAAAEEGELNLTPTFQRDGGLVEMPVPDSGRTRTSTDPAPDQSCVALQPWVIQTNDYLNQVRELYKNLEDAYAAGPEQAMNALDLLGYGAGQVVEEMKVTQVPAEAKAAHDELVLRLDEVAWAYTDLVTAIIQGDAGLTQQLLNDIPTLERELVRAVTDFENTAKECGIELSTGEAPRTRDRG